MDVTRPCKITWFGDIYTPKQYDFVGIRWTFISQTPVHRSFEIRVVVGKRRDGIVVYLSVGAEPALFCPVWEPSWAKGDGFIKSVPGLLNSSEHARLINVTVYKFRIVVEHPEIGQESFGIFVCRFVGTAPDILGLVGPALGSTPVRNRRFSGGSLVQVFRALSAQPR
jgi:hypothetical protein